MDGEDGHKIQRTNQAEQEAALGVQLAGRQRGAVAHRADQREEQLRQKGRGHEQGQEVLGAAPQAVVHHALGDAQVQVQRAVLAVARNQGHRFSEGIIAFLPNSAHQVRVGVEDDLLAHRHRHITQVWVQLAVFVEHRFQASEIIQRQAQRKGRIQAVFERVGQGLDLGPDAALVDVGQADNGQRGHRQEGHAIRDAQQLRGALLPARFILTHPALAGEEQEEHVCTHRDHRRTLHREEGPVDIAFYHLLGQQHVQVADHSKAIAQVECDAVELIVLGHHIAVHIRLDGCLGAQVAQISQALPVGKDHLILQVGDVNGIDRSIRLQDGLGGGGEARELRKRQVGQQEALHSRLHQLALGRQLLNGKARVSAARLAETDEDQQG